MANINWDNYHLGITPSGRSVLIVYKPKPTKIKGILEVQDSVDRTDEFLSILPKYFEHLEKEGLALIYPKENGDTMVILSLDLIMDKLKTIKENAEEIEDLVKTADLEDLWRPIEEIIDAVDDILKLKKAVKGEKKHVKA